MNEKRHAAQADWLSTQLSDPEFQRALAQEEAAFEFVYAIEDAMRDQNISRAELAKRLGKSRAFITQALRRGHNLTFRTAGDLAWGCGLKVKVTLQPACVIG